MARPTALFRLYQAGSALALPFAARKSVRKLLNAGVIAMRAHEKLGHTTAERRLGPLIWLHGASVGEVKSILPLLALQSEMAPHVQFLLTSGTASSAQAVQERLPERAAHQFAPLDASGPLNRFFRHWRPNLCVLVESELWPNTLDQCARRNIPVALLNARMSDKSARNWKRFQGSAAYVMRGIKYAHCQDTRTRDHLRDLGLSFAQTGINLKSIVPAPTIDKTAQDRVWRDLNGRPVWLAASTHPSEDDIIIKAHQELLKTQPNLCLVLAPRHPERADQIVDLLRASGLTFARRSTKDTIENASVYLADTLGEMDLWYDLCPFVFVAGSFSDVGGHTPFEPAARHCAILHGPKYANFSEAYATFHQADAAIEVTDAAALADALQRLLSHPNRAAVLSRNARTLAHNGADALPRLAQDLFELAGVDYES